MLRTIDRAEAAGLVQRQPDPNNRRARVITLTPAGDDVLADLAPRRHRCLRTVIHDVLSDDEVESLVDSLEHIQRACADHQGVNSA